VEGVKRSLLLLCAVSFLASCGNQGSTAEAPSFTLTPMSTAASTLPPSSQISALLPSFELLAAQLEQTNPGASASGLSEGALIDEDLPSTARVGWKRTWQVSDTSEVSGVLELRAFAYVGATSASSALSSVLELLSGEKPSGTSVAVRTKDDKTLYVASAAASAQDGTSSVLFSVSLKLPEPDERSRTLVEDTAATLASSLPASFSLHLPE
jgi:hypothetical protein